MFAGALSVRDRPHAFPLHWTYSGKARNLPGAVI
jgi:hypothetical protein